MPDPIQRSSLHRDEPIGDQDLADRVLHGDLGSFEQLMRRHNQRIFRTARAILKDDDDAQDAAQQAWIAAYRHLDTWQRRGAFSTWLVRIVVNEASRRRRRPERSHVRAVDALTDAETQRASPEAEVARTHLRGILEAAIDWLPDHMRAVLVLRDVEELSGKETAECLGLSDEAVRVRLHRARRLLREHLEEILVDRVGEAFPFLGERCDAIVASVMVRIRMS